MVKLEKHERIITAWPEASCGPGWSNTLVWVLISDAQTGTHRIASMQPDEQPTLLRRIYGAWLAMHNTAMGEIGGGE